MSMVGEKPDERGCQKGIKIRPLMPVRRGSPNRGARVRKTPVGLTVDWRWSTTGSKLVGRPGLSVSTHGPPERYESSDVEVIPLGMTDTLHSRSGEKKS